MCFRRLTDIRTTPLLIGIIAVIWSIIPMLDDGDLTLFAKVLAKSGHENVWSALLLTIGATLAVSSICKLRDMLLLSEALAVFMWLSLWALFVSSAPFAPVILQMPLFAASCALCLVREVVFGIRVQQIKDRRKEEREINGMSDLRERA